MPVRNAAKNGSDSPRSLITPTSGTRAVCARAARDAEASATPHATARRRIIAAAGRRPSRRRSLELVADDLVGAGFGRPHLALAAVDLAHVGDHARRLEHLEFLRLGVE